MFYFKTGFIGTFKRQGNFIANEIKPWAKKKNILLTALEGFSFGSERGQIKSLSDHNHIIPLYDFGVGTYDFKLEKVVSEAKLALVYMQALMLNIGMTIILQSLYRKN